MEKFMPGQKASEQERRQQIKRAAFNVAVRKGLTGFTMQDVATEARLSKGLIFFHYQTKDDLLLAMLDTLIEWMLSLEKPDLDLSASERFLKIMQQETDFSGDFDYIGLMLEFWVLGVRHPEMRSRLQVAMASYRKNLQFPVEEVLHAHPGILENIPPEALTNAITSMIIGGALLFWLDPEQFDSNHLMAVLLEAMRGK
jgi:AcrR family transcriptional regulator